MMQDRLAPNEIGVSAIRYTGGTCPGEMLSNHLLRLTSYWLHSEKKSNQTK